MTLQTDYFNINQIFSNNFFSGLQFRVIWGLQLEERVSSVWGGGGGGIYSFTGISLKKESENVCCSCTLRAKLDIDDCKFLHGFEMRIETSVTRVTTLLHVRLTE